MSNENRSLPQNTTMSILDEFFNGNFAKLLVTLIVAMVWVLYITYYNSRVIGYIITRLLTKFYVRKGYLQVGKSYTIREFECIFWPA